MRRMLALLLLSTLIAAGCSRAVPAGPALCAPRDGPSCAALSAWPVGGLAAHFALVDAGAADRRLGLASQGDGGVRVGRYEGCTYWAGHVTFGKAPDGRLVIRHLAFTKNGFVY